MIWQDIAFTIGSIIFIIALMPAVLNERKPPLLTSLSTASVLSVFSVCYYTLDLYFAGTAALITAIIWYLLALQVYAEEQETKEYNDTRGKIDFL